MRTATLLLVAALLLAGCSGNKGSSDDGTPAASSTTTSTGPPPPPVVTSDLLHFLEIPLMASSLPENGDEISTATSGGGFGGGGGGGQEAPEWSYVITTPVNITAGEVRVWIQITETLVQSPTGFPPGQPACTWLVRLELGADNVVDVPCLVEPAGPISPVTKELVFPFAGSATQLETNETVSVRFDRRAFGPSTTPSVFILSGTEEHDSRVQLNGLKEPVLAS